MILHGDFVDHPVVRFYYDAAFYLASPDFDVIDFLSTWGIKEMEQGRKVVADIDSVARALPQFKHDSRDFSLFVLKNPWSSAAATMAEKTLQPVEAVICKQLKAAHASGVGCGKPQIWNSRAEIVRHVQDSPLNLCASSVPCPAMGAMLRHRGLILRVIERLVYRDYAEYKIDDWELLRYMV